MIPHRPFSLLRFRQLCASSQPHQLYGSFPPNIVRERKSNISIREKKYLTHFNIGETFLLSFIRFSFRFGFVCLAFLFRLKEKLFPKKISTKNEIPNLVCFALLFCFISQSFLFSFVCFSFLLSLNSIYSIKTTIQTWYKIYLICLSFCFSFIS